MEELNLGSTAVAKVKLLPSKHLRQNLKSGDSFTFLEGMKSVGTGVTKEILEKTIAQPA